MRTRYRTSKLTNLLRKTLGYAAKRNVSFWDLLDRALAKHGIRPTVKFETRAARDEWMFNAGLMLQSQLGISSERKRPVQYVANEVSGDDFLQTYEWRVLRMQALKKHGARCQCCGATPASGARMNVDHIKPRKIYPQLALDINNLQVLCDECNHGKGNWDMTDWRNSQDINATSC